MKISSTEERKPDEVSISILPRFVSDTNVDLEDQNLDEKKKDEVPIPEALSSQAKLASTKSGPAKKDSACQSESDFIFIGYIVGYIIVAVLLILLGVSIVHLDNSANSQIEHHNNLVRYVNHIKDTVVKNQEILFNTINDGTTKFNELATDLKTLNTDLKTLKDSVKLIEEKLQHIDEEARMETGMWIKLLNRQLKRN